MNKLIASLWLCVLIALIVALCLLGSSEASSNSQRESEQQSEDNPSKWVVTWADLESVIRNCGWNIRKTPARVSTVTGAGLSPTQTMLPAIQDMTSWNQGNGYESRYPQRLAIAYDTKTGRLVTASGYGIEIWNVSSPGFVTRKYYTLADESHIPPGSHDFLKFQSVATDNNGHAIVTGISSVGFAVYSMANGALLYQDSGSGSNYKMSGYGGVAAANGYGFLAARNPGEGIWQYDLSQAELSAGCWEQLPTVSRCTPNDEPVFIRRYPGIYRQVSAVSNLVVGAGGGQGDLGMTVWDSTTGTRLFSGLQMLVVEAVSMWQLDGSTFIATITRVPSSLTRTASIYRFECKGGACSIAQHWSRVLNSSLLPPTMRYSKGYLYIGVPGSYNTTQVEYLYKVTDSTKPIEIGNAAYWEWYYSCNDTGSNNLEPAGGVVVGNVLYRSAGGILDAHGIGGIITDPVPPTIPPTLPPVPPTVPPTKPPTVPPPTPPVIKAVFSVSPEIRVAGRIISFDGSRSTGAARWLWDWDDGVHLEGRIVNRIFQTAGVYDTVLTVLSPGCSTPSCVVEASIKLTVLPDETQPPEPPQPPQTPDDDPTACKPPRVFSAPGRVIYRPGTAGTGRIELEILGPWQCSDNKDTKDTEFIIPNDASNDEMEVTQ